MYKAVREQQQYFGLKYKGEPRELSVKERKFYVEALYEEIEEYTKSKSLEEQYDAVLDILVFAIGLLSRHGFDPRGIREVTYANMRKIMGPNAHKRGQFELDLIKPDGWVGPDLRRFL